ncbi:MAG TPA: mobile mystery protein B [Actinomycetota bacterium]
MTDPLAPIGDGHTELSEEDRQGLIPSYISTRGELNEAEQRNIVRATATRRPPTPGELLDDQYLRALHKAMFDEVWRWAGQYRRRETNIGIEPARIPSEVRSLTDDARSWIEHETYDRDELCVRFHHRLVAIHPFPNGNGRHGRIAADYLIAALGRDRFSWGAGLGVTTEELRVRYLKALHLAGHEIEALVAFARS